MDGIEAGEKIGELEDGARLIDLIVRVDHFILELTIKYAWSIPLQLLTSLELGLEFLIVDVEVLVHTVEICARGSVELRSLFIGVSGRGLRS